MEAKPRIVHSLVLDNGSCPFDEWLESLENVAYQVAVDARISRIRAGNFGDHKGVGEGVFELRLPKGPGLRVYYGRRGNEIVILLGGGDKSTQSEDIRRAQELWRTLKT